MFGIKRCNQTDTQRRVTTCPGSSREPPELGCLGFTPRPGSHRRGGWGRPPSCSTRSPGLPVHPPRMLPAPLSTVDLDTWGHLAAPPGPPGMRGLFPIRTALGSLPFLWVQGHCLTPSLLPQGGQQLVNVGVRWSGPAWPKSARLEGPPTQAPVGSEGLGPTLQLRLCPYFPRCEIGRASCRERVSSPV